MLQRPSFSTIQSNRLVLDRPAPLVVDFSGVPLRRRVFKRLSVDNSVASSRSRAVQTRTVSRYFFSCVSSSLTSDSFSMSQSHVSFSIVPHLSLSIFSVARLRARSLMRLCSRLLHLHVSFSRRLRCTASFSTLQRLSFSIIQLHRCVTRLVLDFPQRLIVDFSVAPFRSRPSGDPRSRLFCCIVSFSIRSATCTSRSRSSILQLHVSFSLPATLWRARILVLYFFSCTVCTVSSRFSLSILSCTSRFLDVSVSYHSSFRLSFSITVRSRVRPYARSQVQPSVRSRVRLTSWKLGQ